MYLSKKLKSLKINRAFRWINTALTPAHLIHYYYYYYRYYYYTHTHTHTPTHTLSLSLDVLLICVCVEAFF